MASNYGSTSSSPREQQKFEEEQPWWYCTPAFRPSDLLAPAAYLLLYTVFDILCARSAHSDGGYYRFEPAVMVLVIEAGKWVASGLLLLVNPPDEMPTFSELTRNAKALSSVAVCFTALNILNLVCLSHVPLSSYSLWCQTGIIFNAFIWYATFRTPFSRNQIMALCLLVLGCCVNTIHPGWQFHVDSHVPLVVLAAMLSALGCVLNEYFVKREARLDLNIMNMLLYAETSVTALLVAVAISAYRSKSIILIFDGFHGDCWLIAAVSICIGLAVSRILKYTSSICKNFVMAAHCPLEVVCAHKILKTELSSYTLASAVLIGMAACLYYFPSPAEKIPK